jgi:hypothetical protein
MSKVRKKEGEKLDDSNVQKVFELLSRTENPISKKEACELLNITYNSSRLQKIMEEHVERVNYISARKKALRNTPVDILDKKFMVESYLSGVSLSEISDSTFRSTDIIKKVLRGYNIPLRSGSVDYFHPVEVEEFAEDYVSGDLVFSARYNSVAKVCLEVESKNSISKTYRIWVYGSIMQFAYQPAHELADLRKLQKELSINVTLGISKEDIIYTLNDAIRNKKKVTDED